MEGPHYAAEDERRVLFEIRGGTGAPRDARDALDEMTKALLPDVRERARLMVSELTTNSVRHADAGPGDVIRVLVDVTAALLHVDVIDDGPGFARPQSPRGEPTGGGWGLSFVDAMSDHWGVELDESTRVWFDIGLVPAAQTG
jgi:anti-sigma regulatory factor (Ser/Thr protein kinase)